MPVGPTVTQLLNQAAAEHDRVLRENDALRQHLAALKSKDSSWAAPAPPSSRQSSAVTLEHEDEVPREFASEAGRSSKVDGSRVLSCCSTPEAQQLGVQVKVPATEPIGFSGGLEVVTRSSVRQSQSARHSRTSANLDEAVFCSGSSAFVSETSESFAMGGSGPLPSAHGGSGRMPPRASSEGALMLNDKPRRSLLEQKKELANAKSTSRVSLGKAQSTISNTSNKENNGQDTDTGEIWPIWLEDSVASPALFMSPASLLLRQSRSNIFQPEAVRGGDTLKDDSFLQMFVIGPNCKRRILWDVLSVLVVSYDVLTVPLIAFALLDLPFFRIAGLMTTCFWTADLPFQFFCGLHVGGIVEMRPKKIAMYHLRGWFFMDLVIVVTDWMLVILQSGLGDVVGMMRISKTLRLGRILRLFRLFRMMRLPAITDDISGNVQSEAMLTALGVLRSASIIAIANHFISCGWYAVGTYSTLRNEPSWIDEMDEQARDTGYRYCTSLHWSLTQFTPASMEIVPRNSLERLFAILIVFSALVTFSTFVSSITTAMATLRRITNERSKQQTAIRKYIADNRVSVDLGNRITAFLRTHNVFVKRRVHEADIQVFKVLPEALRLQLHWEVYTPHLSTHPFFHHVMELDEEGLLALCHHGTSELYLDTSQELFRSGDECNTMYLVVVGNLEYYMWSKDANPVEVADGQWICEAVLWVKWQHQGRLSAVSPCELITLEASRFRTILSHRANMLTPCRHYAKLYSDQMATWGKGHPSDVWWDFDEAQEMAQKAFEGVQSEEPEEDPGRKRPNRVLKMWRSWSPMHAFHSPWGKAPPRRTNTL